MKTFRIDDVSINTDPSKLLMFIEGFAKKYSNCRIILGVSPLVHDMGESEGKARERVFPEILNAYSDYRLFYNVNIAGIPQGVIEKAFAFCSNIILAGHGIVHVDHRLLTKEVQEISILVSCSLVGAKYFIPPFNKYNKFTEEICKEHGIKLIRFEDGWKHLKYNKIEDKFDFYYLHTHDFTEDDIVGILK